MKRTLIATALVLASNVQAQNNCPCNGGVGTQLTGTTSPTLGAALAGKMACGTAGTERWQEWHNGNAAGGVVIDFKLGPGHPVDPSGRVGTYSVSTAGTNSTVSYAYGGSTNYAYRVCRVGSTSYAFCGAALGGRDIAGVIVGGSGSLQSCDTVVNQTVATASVRPQQNSQPPTK